MGSPHCCFQKAVVAWCLGVAKAKELLSPLIQHHHKSHHCPRELTAVVALMLGEDSGPASHEVWELVAEALVREQVQVERHERVARVPVCAGELKSKWTAMPVVG